VEIKVVLKFNAHLVKCRLKYGLCNPPLVLAVVVVVIGRHCWWWLAVIFC